jgi:hypothetical protein
MLKEAESVGWRFFQEIPLTDKMKTNILFNEVGTAKGLSGYNIPNAAKELYR